MFKCKLSILLCPKYFSNERFGKFKYMAQSAVCYFVFASMFLTQFCPPCPGSWVSCLCSIPMVSLNGSSISFIFMRHHPVTSVCRSYCHHVLSASTLVWKSPHFPQPPLPTSPSSFTALHWNGSAKPWYLLRCLRQGTGSLSYWSSACSSPLIILRSPTPRPGFPAPTPLFPRGAGDWKSKTELSAELISV